MRNHSAETWLEFRVHGGDERRITEMGRVHPINPFDLAAAIDIDQYEAVIRSVAADDNIDVVLWYTTWNGEDAVKCAKAIEGGATSVDVSVVV